MASERRIIAFVFVFLFTSCTIVAIDPPVAPPPSAPVAMTSKRVEFDGGFALEFDTVNVEVAGSVKGASAARVSGVLTDGTGRRELRVRTARGQLVTVASSDWNFPPALVEMPSTTSVCWNRLTGSEPRPGWVPSPAAGLELVCRLFDSTGRLGPPVTVAGGSGAAPAWLLDVEPEGDDLRLIYLEDSSGVLAPEFGRRFVATLRDGAVVAKRPVDP